MERVNKIEPRNEPFNTRKFQPKKSKMLQIFRQTLIGEKVESKISLHIF